MQSVKLFLFAFLCYMLIANVHATEESLGTFKQLDCVRLKQTCANCTYVNISSVVYPNSTIAVSNALMTKSGTEFNYSFCNTGTLGNYIVNGYGDPDGIKTIFSYEFEITPTGYIGTLGFYILILAISFGVIVFAFIIKDAPMAILGSFGLYFVGIFILFYGIVGLKDAVTTWAFGLIVLAIALYISIRSALELLF